MRFLVLVLSLLLVCSIAFNASLVTEIKYQQNNRFPAKTFIIPNQVVNTLDFHSKEAQSILASAYLRAIAREDIPLQDKLVRVKQFNNQIIENPTDWKKSSKEISDMLYYRYSKNGELSVSDWDEAAEVLNEY